MTVEENVKFSWEEAFWNFSRVNKDASGSRSEEDAKKSKSFVIESDSYAVLEINLGNLCNKNKIYTLK